MSSTTDMPAAWEPVESANSVDKGMVAERVTMQEENTTPKPDVWVRLSWGITSFLWQLWFWFIAVSLALQLSVECYGTIVVVPAGTSCAGSANSSALSGTCLDGDFTFTRPSISYNKNYGNLSDACSQPCDRPEDIRLVTCSAASGRAEAVAYSLSDGSVQITPWLDSGTPPQDACVPFDLDRPSDFAISGLQSIANASLIPLLGNVNMSVPTAGLLARARLEQSLGFSCSILSANYAYYVSSFGSSYGYAGNTSCQRQESVTDSNLATCAAAQGTTSTPCRRCIATDSSELTTSGLFVLGAILLLHIAVEGSMILRYTGTPLASLPIVGMTWGFHTYPLFKLGLSRGHRLWWLLAMLSTIIGTAIVMAGGQELDPAVQVMLPLACVAVCVVNLYVLLILPVVEYETHDFTCNSKVNLVLSSRAPYRNKLHVLYSLVLLLLAEYDIAGDVLFVYEVLSSDIAVASYPPSNPTCDSLVSSGFAGQCRMTGTEINMQDAGCFNSLVGGQLTYRLRDVIGTGEPARSKWGGSTVWEHPSGVPDNFLDAINMGYCKPSDCATSGGFCWSTTSGSDAWKADLGSCVRNYLTNTSNNCLRSYDVDATFCSSVVALDAQFTCSSKDIQADSVVALFIRLLAIGSLLWALRGIAASVYLHGWQQLPLARTYLFFAVLKEGDIITENTGVVASLGEDLPMLISSALYAIASGNVAALISLTGTVSSLGYKGYKTRTQPLNDEENKPPQQAVASVAPE